MTCVSCGARCQGRKCKTCLLNDRAENMVARQQGDTGADVDEPTLVECTADGCGQEYWYDGDNACPECGARRRRYVGPLDGKADNRPPVRGARGGRGCIELRERPGKQGFELRPDGGVVQSDGDQGPLPMNEKGEGLLDALQEACAHEDLLAYVRKARARGGTGVLSSLRRFHRGGEGAVGKFAELGTSKEQTLWDHGAALALEQRGPWDVTNQAILEEIVAERVAVGDALHHLSDAVGAFRDGDLEDGVRHLDEARLILEDGPTESREQGGERL